MPDRFQLYIDRILSHEGGFTLLRSDPGNWTGGRVGEGILKGTKFGVAANTYPSLDIKNLTRPQAVEIYRRDFWQAIKADRLPAAFSYQLLDAAVNHGIGNASRMLQSAARVAPDGAVGPITLKAIAAMDVADLVLRFIGARLRFYAALSKFDTFGRGWINRMAANAEFAAEDN